MSHAVCAANTTPREPSNAEKARAVLGLLRGDPPDAVAREYCVTEQTVRRWERAFARVADAAFGETNAAEHDRDEPETFGLARLLGGDCARAFHEGRWPEQVHVEHGPVERVGLPAALFDLEAIVRAPGVHATLFGEKGFRAGVVNATDALAFHRAGTTLYLTGLGRAFPTLQRMSDALARELDLAPAHLAIEAFASPRGGTGSSLHYDFDVNFNVQLVGEKRWRVAPNHHVENPLHSLAVREGVPAVHPFDGSLLPTELPVDAACHDVGPGGVVFLPRGFWHETVVMSESFAIAFVVKPPPFFRLFADELVARLQQRACWRAYGLGRDRKAAFERALAELPALVAEISADEVLFNRVRVRWGADTTRLLTAAPSGAADPWLLTVECAAGSFELPVTRALANVVRWMVEADTEFSTEAAATACPDCSVAQARGVVTYLVDMGILERA